MSNTTSHQTILYLIPTLTYGGAERQMVELINQLNRNRFEPILCVIYSEVISPIHVRPKDCQVIVLNKPLGKWGNVILFVRLYTLVKHYKPSTVHSFLPLANFHARLLGIAFRKLQIITSIRIEIRNFWRVYEKLAERLMWQLSDAIIVNSGHIKTGLVNELAIPTEKIAVIHNGVDTGRFCPILSKRDARIQLGIPLSVVVFGVVARYSEQKGYDTLINAITLMQQNPLPNPIKVICIGEESQIGFKDELNLLLENQAIAHLIELRDPLSEVEILYNAIDVLILPSRQEGFPNAVLEAFATGKPAIISQSANEVDIVKDGETGWVFPTNNVQALVNCMQLAMSISEEEREKMGVKAMELINTNYANYIMAHKTESFYQAPVRT